MKFRQATIVSSLLTAALFAVVPISSADETGSVKPIRQKEEAFGQRTQRIKWFLDARFGMFIHWGPVALKGTEIGWSRGRQVPKDEYDQLYRKFNPTEFNAEARTLTAKQAGMRYLVLTTKHHDGFCLWPSQYTDYDIDNTPFRIGTRLPR